MNGRAVMFLFVIMACVSVLVVVHGLNNKMVKRDATVFDEVLTRNQNLAQKKLK